MEHLILNLPSIFCVLTGILIAWGLRVSICLANIIHTVHQFREHVRTSEVINLFVVVAITTGLAVLLFGFPSIAAFHMSNILLLEFWYAMYLFSVSEASYFTEQEIQRMHCKKLHPFHFLIH